MGCFICTDLQLKFMSQKKNIAILGSTGSIGTQALEVAQQFPASFSVNVLTAHHNVELLIRQALKFKPQAVVIVNEEKYARLKEALSKTDIEVHAGKKALEEVACLDQVDIVLTALVGFAGLQSTICAIKAGKTIALANKETLVVAGSMIMSLAAEHGVDIIPVDSEHSALFQCLVGEKGNPIEKIYLTASGGPFRGYSLERLKGVSRAQALKHPNWEMGAKITIDSASMMNKGLEVIEARWLFGLSSDQIEVIIHPQSIIHSIVQFEDGSMKAQMGLPDMRLPIQYAMAYPERLSNRFPRFDFFDSPSLTFEEVDSKVFKNLALAYQSMALGGNMPCILNAANEITNKLFREDNISFTDIADLNEATMAALVYEEKPDLESLIRTDGAARNWVTKRAKVRT